MPAQPQAVAPHVPLRIGTDEQFKIVREFFLSSGFTREAVRARVTTDLPEAVHAQGADWGRNPATAADLLTWIFVLGQPGPRDHVHRFLLPYIVDAMTAIGLLTRDPGGSYCSAVFLAPVEGLYFAGDRWFNPDGSNVDMCADVVYPASSPNTAHFLDLLPKTPCERLLDIGCGSGVLAFAAGSTYARRVWATDIAERSCTFAEFNRRLNAMDNAQVLRGDLYEPLANESFDRILAHPPYVPVLKPKWIFSDGGEDGELLTRRIVAGLPRHLSAGGLFFCDATGSDRDRPFEERVREWLGSSESEFDVAVFVQRTHEPQQFAEVMAGRDHSMGTASELLASLQRHNIRSILRMMLCIQRVSTSRPVFTVRRRFGEKESAAAVPWLLQLETHAADSLEWVMQERPTLPRWFTMHITSKPGEQGFTPIDYQVRTNHPFVAYNLIEPWMASLLNLCVGRWTTAELFHIALENGYIPQDSAGEKFAALMVAFASNGVVELPSFPLPPE